MNTSNSFKFIDILFRDNPNLAVKHHVESYNNFFKKELRDIMMYNNPKKFFTELDPETNQYKYTANMYFGGKNGDKIYYGKPVIYDKIEDEYITHFMFPNEARLRNMTYAFSIHYDVDVDFIILKDTGEGEGSDKYERIEETYTIEKVLLGRFPIMLHSYLCILNGLNPEVRFNMGECRNDLGGYFIIDGKEKVIMSQEGRANNILYIKDKVNDIFSHAAEIRSVSEDLSKPIRTLSVRIVASTPVLENNQIVVNIPNIRKPVPLFILMRALGFISDKEIIETCLLDLEKNKELIDLFIPCVYDAGNIFTQQSALKYLALLTKGKSIYHVQDILSNYFLPHIGERNYKHKAYYLGYIVKRLLLVFIKAEPPTNRDKYNAKRIEHAGILISQLFREFYKKQLKNIELIIDKEYFFANSNASISYQDEDFMNIIRNNQNMIFEDKIVEKGFRKAFKGDWGGEVHTKRPGIVQTLNRLSYFSFMCQLRKTNLHIGSDGAKVVEPRLLNGTQYGLLCPIHSPDGGNVGLHKHLSTSTHITSGVPSGPYISYLRKLNMLLLEECSLDMMANSTKIFLNGGWIGMTISPTNLVKTLKLHRRNNIIYTYTSILFDIKRNEIQMWVDAGRPCRPLFYKENDKVSFDKKNIKDSLDDGSLTWKEIFCGFDNEYNSFNITNIHPNIKSEEKLETTKAIVDYIDASEGEGIKIAKSTLTFEDIVASNNTHIEIHPSLILGFMANQIIFPENNPYPRNAFSCGQAKQGVSLYHSNFKNRIDKSAFVLNYGQSPLTKSRYLKYFTQEEQPYGENAIVAIMCYSGYNVEDAVIINKGSLERGLFNTTYFNMYEDHEESTKIGGGKIDSQFMNIQNNEVYGVKEGYDYSKLHPITGIIKENSVVNEKTIVIGKGNTSLLEPDTFIDSSIKCKKGQTGIVDKSFISEGELGQRIAKIRIRATRIPDIGDKFCSRAGQKGTIGIILPEEDMPCTSDGLKPDIIVNPHAMPSRMTIGHIVEALISKASCLHGCFGDCTAFINKGMKQKEFGEILTRNGYNNSGNEILYNGMTGEQLETEIYIGPTYYLRLKHMPKDKINYRARGPRSVLTRQTVGGRANDGGLRIGEMDRDCLLAHGMANFIKETMLVRGDEYYMAVCNQSGTIAIYNESKNLFLSPMLDGPLKFVENIENNMNIIQKSKFGRDFSIVRVPYAFKLLMQELKTMNVQIRIITEDNVDRLTSLYYGEHNIVKEKTQESMSKKKFENMVNNKIKPIENEMNEDNVEEDIKETLPNDPILLKEKLEMLDPNMDVVDSYFDGKEWDVEGMKEDILNVQKELANQPIEKPVHIEDDNLISDSIKKKQRELSDDMDMGATVMIWMDGQLLDQKFQVMGTTIDGKRTVRNTGDDDEPAGSEIYTVDEKYIITKNMLLKNPDALNINESIDENEILDSNQDLINLNTQLEQNNDFVNPVELIEFGDNTPSPLSPPNSYDMRLSNIEEVSGEIGEELPEEGKKTEVKIDLEAKENEGGLSMIMPKSEPEDKKEDEEDTQRKSMVIN
jgi:DNA-directed RNA polymerase II subunit RPB2